MKEWKRWVWLLVLLGLVACGVGNPTPELIPETTTETLEGPDVILFQQVGLDKVYIVKSIDSESAQIEVCGWSKGDGKYDKFVTCGGQVVSRDQVIQELDINLTTEEILEIFLSIVRQFQN